jgi:lipoic acid synthetase
MILGDRCTRRCHFCSVKTAKPLPVRDEEPGELSKAVAALDLKHVVITSVDRDELPDLGTSQFVRCIQTLRQDFRQLAIELLTPDFKGRFDLIDHVLSVGPDVWGHNTETVPRLYQKLRPQSKFETSMKVLEYLAKTGLVQVKSGLMVGLGEKDEEVSDTLELLRSIGVHVVTIGQYLAPSRNHWPVSRYVEPASYESWISLGKRLGFQAIFAGPFVRSSFHAKEVHEDSKRAF